MGVNVGHYAPLCVPAMLPKRGIPYSMKGDRAVRVRIRIEIFIADERCYAIGAGLLLCEQKRSAFTMATSASA